MTKYAEAMRALVDTRTRTDHYAKDGAREVAETCVWLEEAVRLYGRRRVESELRRMDDVLGSLWLAYWRTWRSGQTPHMIPTGLLVGPEEPVMALAPVLVFAPQLAAA